MTNESVIWSTLLEAGLSKASAAGMMGNLYDESGFLSTNLQDGFEKKTGMADADYTTAVDNGTYAGFVNDGAGYGLAQWTFWSRKKRLLEFAKTRGVSVGDFAMQIDFIVDELKEFGMIETLSKMTSVPEASDFIMLQYEKPADQSAERIKKRERLSQDFYNTYTGSSASAHSSGATGLASKTSATSKLPVFTQISPNKTSPRNHAIDRITIHCVVGQCTAEELGTLFNKKSTGASSNYGVDRSGRIGLYVAEGDRSFCSSNAENDHRAITIETASDTFHPYAVTAAAYDGLIRLCVDICQRRGKKKLVWLNDKKKALTYIAKPDEMVMTAHRWFANKACPGDYLYSRFGDIANEVTQKLGEQSSGAASHLASQPQPAQKTQQDVSANSARPQSTTQYAHAVSDAVANSLHKEDDMTLDEFKDKMGEFRADLQDNDCGLWSQEARDWAVKAGIVVGMGAGADGTPNYAWQDFLTREQLMVVLYRLFGQK